ncbi:TUDOR [Seminavis robusta]|uniref:TUDOR n=1 Tax=Seminavis robusta TaxID=568900 RepID=A0A9N8H544_9STRA|nr:TUDOR [Seminavis robusta]|eukprot:Sro65_g036810.1 TUDOR (1939) ;mRNA; f:84746-90724
MTEQDETRNSRDDNISGDDDSENDHHHLEEDDQQHRKRTWEESFALLEAYQKKHGHCQVPIRFDQDRRLGRWVYSQRIRRDKLTSDQIRRLEELGFEHDDDDDDENDQATKTTITTSIRRASHHELEEDDDEDEEEDDDEEEEEVSPAPPPPTDDDLLESGFTQTGRRRKTVKRYGITDNDDESDIARRRKEQLQQQRQERRQRQQQQHQPPKPKANTSTVTTTITTPSTTTTSTTMTAPKQSPTPKKVVPAPAPTPPPPEEDDEDEEEDPDYDSEQERRARERRRKQRRQQQQQTANKRGRPKGRPRGRPRKETLQEKLEQIVVGSRLAVLWPAENEYYRASVSKVVEGRKRPYYLEYDDGETEWIDLATGMTEFLVLTPRIGPRKRNRSKASSSSNNNHNNSASSSSQPSTPTRTMMSQHKTDSCSRTTPTSAARSTTSSTNHNHNNNSPPDIQIGARVSVYWSDDEQYYEATVVKQRRDRNHPKPFKLEYEDGEYEWIDLHQVKFRFLDRGDDSVISPHQTCRVKAMNGRDHGGDRRRNITTSEDSSSSSGSASDSSSSSTSGDDSDIELVSDVRQVHVGARVAVYWSEEERYFEGTVTEHRMGHPRPFFMQYDDGDTQWLDLRTRNFCVLKRCQRRKKRRRSSSGRKRRRRRIDTSSSDSSSGSEQERHRAVGGRFSLARQNVRRKPPPAASRSRPKCLSPTPTETSATTDDEREDRLESREEPHPHKEIALGTRVAVFCPIKDKFLDGTVTHRQIPRNSRSKPCYFVTYDKGHSEWVELPKRKVRFLTEEDASIATKIPGAKRGRKRKPHDSPLLRMLREKEARKANPDLEMDDDEEPDKPKTIEEDEKRPETTDDDDDEESSSDSEESLDATSEDEESIQVEVEPEVPEKPLVMEQVGIGTRIAVQCPKELKFMEGIVTRLIRNRRKPLYVEYDIGGFEWIDLHSSTVKLLTEEEEKLLKEQSAIVIKEEFEEALPEVQTEPCIFDEDVNGNKDVMEVDDDAPASKSEVDVVVDAEGADDSNKEETAAERVDGAEAEATKDTTTPASNLDGESKMDVEMTDVSMEAEETEEVSTLEAKTSSENENEESVENSVPQLEDEVIEQSLPPASSEEAPREKHTETHQTPPTIAKPEKEQPTIIVPDSCDNDYVHKPPSTHASLKPSGLIGVSKIDIPTRVSDSEAASCSEKDSPTGVACLLGASSSSRNKASKVAESLVVSVAIPEPTVPLKPVKPSESTVAPNGSAADNMPTTKGHDVSTDPAAIITTTDPPPSDIVRVAPVSIVSETIADGLPKCGDVVTINREKELHEVNLNISGGNSCKIDRTETVRRVSSEASVDDPVAQNAKQPDEQEQDVNAKHGENPAPKDEDNDAKALSPVGQESHSGGKDHGAANHSDAPDDAAGAAKPRNGKGMFVRKAPEKAVAAPDVLPAKRKRGRPPKYRNDEKHEPAVVPSDRNEDSKADTSSPPPAKKRGPGRPPKHRPLVTSKPEQAAKNGKTNVHVIAQQDATPKKRGPGRPPKKKNLVKHDTHEHTRKETAEPEPPKKRGPGRPPKHPKADAPKISSPGEAAPPKKRGPGRPRKSESQAVAVAVAAAAAQESPAPVKKRGPGRPRKSECQEPKKRGPGRPRKTPKKDEADEEVARIEKDVFKVTMVNGSRHRKEPNRFSPTDFDESDSDSSVDTGANRKTSGSTPLKKSDLGAEHAEKARQVEVGMRVSVYWGGDQEYYPGTVTKERSYRKKKFFLEYDDGESEWIDFHRNKFHILTPPKNLEIVVTSPKADENDAVDDEDDSDDDSAPIRRRSSDDDTDPSVRFRNRMDMSDVMLRIKTGCRVEVFWSEDNCYYPGTITKQRDNIIQAKKPWFLEYDDGESEWIDLRDHVFRMIAGAGEEAAPTPVGDSNVPDPATADKEKRKREKDADDSSCGRKQKRLKRKNSG